ncbi:alpha/beta fold hydrolase [Streptomyces sp. NPDC059076]|uniref:alpha/beta fold hydrolase n=1 Tax=unclassified Streptomyces TaxID=2593676 RepID=UPI00369CAB75
MNAPAVSGAHIIASGSRIHVDTAGRHGSPVLLLHGIGSSAASFAGQLVELARQHRVMAWDAPGYARSDDPKLPFRMDDFADAAAAVLTALAPGPAHVVGVSWGGVIATRLALRHPGLVRSLVLADSTRGSGRTPEGAAAMRERVHELTRDGVHRFAHARAPRLLSARAPASAVAAVRDVMAASVRLPGYAEAAASMADTDHTAALPGLKLPTLVLVGEHDQITGVEESRTVQRLVPDSRLTVIPGAGHLANQERPDLFTALVADFLAEQDGFLAERDGFLAERDGAAAGPATTADAHQGDGPGPSTKEDPWTSD